MTSFLQAFFTLFTGSTGQPAVFQNTIGTYAIIVAALICFVFIVILICRVIADIFSGIFRF